MKSKYLVLGATCALLLAGCGGGSGGETKKVPVTGVTLNRTSASLEVGDTLQLTATVAPKDADNSNVTWSASGDGIVSVDDGLVTALAEGRSTVTVTTVDGGFTATCEFTVTEGSTTIAVTGVTLNKSSLSLEVGEFETLTATVAPSDATNKNVTWSVTGDAATVSNGTVTAAKAGTSTVTVTTADGGFTATCTVTVTEASTKPEGAVDLEFSTDGDLAKHGDNYVYFNNPEWWEGAHADVNEAYIYDGTVVYDFTLNPESSSSAPNWCNHLMRKNTSLTQGTAYDLTLNINSDHAGTVVVNDKEVALVKGDNDVAVTYTQGDGASINIQFPVAFGSGRVELSNVSWEAALVAPVGIVVNYINNEYIIAFAAVTGATGYKAYYVNSATEEDVDNEVVTNGGKLTKVSSLADGKYKIFVSTIQGEKESARSTGFATIEIGEHQDVVPAGGPKTNIGFGEEHSNGVLALPDDKFVYWNDQGWCGSSITVSEAYTEEGTVHATYEVAAEYDPWNQGYEGCDYAFQIFYKNTSLTADKAYTLKYTVVSDLGGTVGINGGTTELVAKEAKEISVTYTEVANDASFRLVFSSRLGKNNTIVISNISWVEAN